MTEEIYNEKKLIDLFKQSVGLEKAEKTIKNALNKTGLLGKKNNLTQEDLMKVCNFIKEDEKGLINVVATCLIVRINLSQMEL